MATVYLTQLPHKRDLLTRDLVPAFNVAPATEHGELIVLMPPQCPVIETDTLMGQLIDKLRFFSAADGDSLLPLGDPVVIACATAVLARRGRTFAVLRWDKNLKRYIRVSVFASLTHS